MTRKFSVIIERDKHGYFAYCPELKGCHTQGDSIEGALDNLKEAIELYVETLTPKELNLLSSKNILSTSLEVSCA